MNENTRNTLYVTVALALALGLVVVVLIVGTETLRTLALIVVLGSVAALLLAASSLPIRAWRRQDAAPVERHYIHNNSRETRIIDARAPQPPQIYQVPSQAQQAAFPEVLRAAWQAGLLTSASQSEPSDLPQLPDEWTGNIRG